ncbi:MAG TPA: glycosyltransferase family 39 protein [Chthoniobacterales bacterium]|jgi:4-amino-4-deoxy-L-arabinose transferase-like glycosyltransferase|nr:glycosyltransferase family 39 protein [Chthoniobacterales bacterium]
MAPELPLQNPGPDGGRKRRPRLRPLFWTAAAIAVVALAAYLRFRPISGALPYSDYIDEGYVLNQTIDHLNRKSYDCDYYNYPPLPSYLTAGALITWNPIYRLLHGHRLYKDLPRDPVRMTPLGHNYNLLAPLDVIVAGRIIVAMASVITVIVAGMLAMRLAGSQAALIAMLLCGVCPALVFRGSTMIVDSLATLFALGSIYAAERLRAVANLPAAWRNVVLGATGAALAADSKYTVGLAVIPLVLVILTRPFSVRQKLGLLGLAGLTLATVAICCAPALILHPDKILNELRLVAQLYRNVQLPDTYWQAALSELELGRGLVACGLAGVIAMLFSRRVRPVALGWLLFAAMLVLPLVRYRHQPFRNLLPLVPLLCVSAAVLLASRQVLWGVFQRSRVPAIVMTIIAAAISIKAYTISSRYVRDRLGRVDTRVLAVDWLAAHARPGERVLALRELVFVPAELARIPATVQEVSILDGAGVLAGGQFDYIIDADIERGTDDPSWKPRVDEFQAAVSSLPIVANIGTDSTAPFPHIWRGWNQRVIIRRAR